MNKIKTHSVIAALRTIIISSLMVFCLVTCDINKDLNIQITEELNIASYLETDTAQFSDLLKLMDRDITLANKSIIKYSGFLNGYGAYTLFAPTNAAFKTYLAKKNLTSVTQLTNAEVEDLLNFHILQDTISTSKFTDGKLSVPTMYGQYLVTGSSYDGSTTRIRVNKQAYITTKNIALGNGIVHIIDGVLEPAEYTTAYMLENDTRFTIFTQALRETNYYDTLNTVSSEDATSRRWLSVMATPDSVYIANGIADYAALKEKYCNTGNPASVTDSLHLYVGYHILEGLKFIADMTSSSTHATLTSGQVISITISSDTVLINQMTVNGILEKGVAVQRYKSDNSSKNGVWHIMNDDYYIKIRTISRVFFDFADYSQIRSAVTGWGTSYATSAKFLNGTVNGISIYAKLSAYALVTYQANSAVPATAMKDFYVNYNRMTVYFRSTAAVSWIKFTTPFIAAGEYKVWLAYRHNGSSTNKLPVTVMIDSTDMSTAMDFQTYLPSRNAKSLSAYDNYLQGLGFRRPIQIKGQVNYTNNTNVGIYLGKITLTTSSTHWVKFTKGSTEANTNYAYLDYIEFIPVDDDQIWPKYDQDGTAWPRPSNDDYDDTNSAIY